MAGSLPWIDTKLENGQSREEWKAMSATKSLVERGPIPIDGTCVRIGAMRCHPALTIKLTSDVPIDEINDVLANSTGWTDLVPNEREDSMKRLTPAAVTGTLRIPWVVFVSRIRISQRIYCRGSVTLGCRRTAQADATILGIQSD